MYLADPASSKITVIPGAFFRPLERSWDQPTRIHVISRSDLEGSIFLADGPAVDLAISSNGRLLLVSHLMKPRISLVDILESTVVESWSPTGDHGPPLSMAVAPSYSTGSLEELATAVVIADAEQGFVASAYVDEEFQRLREIELSKTETFAASEILLSASGDLGTIVFGSRNHSAVTVQSPVSARTVDLSYPPLDLDVSSDGSVIAILGRQGFDVRIIRRPLEWASSTGRASGSDLVREAQRLLSELRYPVGPIDGIVGPTTREAVQRFQQAAGLPGTGEINDAMMRSIRAAAAESPATSIGDVEPAGCSATDSSLRCEVRYARRDLYNSYAGSAIREVICSAPDDYDLPLQIDAYKLTRQSSEYHCTRFHSCSFIRFRHPLAYERLCAGGSEAPKRRAAAPFELVSARVWREGGVFETVTKALACSAVGCAGKISIGHVFPGFPKSLEVQYRCGHDQRGAIFREHFGTINYEVACPVLQD